jgi:hypothetical protein
MLPREILRRRTGAVALTAGDVVRTDVVVSSLDLVKFAQGGARA